MVDQKKTQKFLSAKNVARLFDKSPGWAYKHWKNLGGKKIGGSIVFPPKEKIIDCYHQLKLDPLSKKSQPHFNVYF